MKPSDCVREGDDYVVSFDTLGIGLEFTRVRESDAAMRALVTPVGLSSRQRLMAPVHTNLFEIAGRERLAKAITERITGKAAPDLRDWKDSLERAFGAVIDKHSTPDPLRILGKEPRVPSEGYLVWPFLARNQVNVLLADQGSGKSYLGLAIAQAVSGGLRGVLPTPFRLLGHGPVIYYDAETDLNSQQERQHRLALALGLAELPDVHYRHIKPPLSNYAAVIRRDVAQLGAVLVIFDSLTFLSGGNLNDSEVAVPTMNAIGECGATTTKLCLAHHGKAGREAGARPSVIGFSGQEFKARSLWLMRRMNEDGEGVAHIDQAWTNFKTSDDRLHRGFGLRLAFDEANTRAELRRLGMDESPWLAMQAGSAEEKIRAALMETEFWKENTTKLAKVVNLSEERVRQVCRKMPDVRMASGGKGRGNVAVWELHQPSVNGPGTNGLGYGFGFSGADDGPEAGNRKIQIPYRETIDLGFPADAENPKTQAPKNQAVGFSEVGDDLPF